MNEIKLGDKVRDKITGFKGIVVWRAEYLYGCVRCGVAPEKTDKDGKVQEEKGFDEPQLEVVATDGKKKKPPMGGGPKREVNGFARSNPK